MEKIEVLNSIINITKESGQGLAGRIVRFKSKEMSDILDELLEEGKIERYIENYNILPDDEWIVPAGCYNSIKDDRTEHPGALTFIRMYLGHKDLGLNMKIQDIITNLTFMTNYVKWLKDNETAILNLVNMKEIEFTPEQLNNDLIEWVKYRSWYKENKSIEECLSLSIEAIGIDKEFISLNEKIIPLYESNSKKYSEDIKKTNSDLENSKKELKIREKVNRWLNNQDKKEKIQTIIK